MNPNPEELQNGIETPVIDQGERDVVYPNSRIESDPSLSTGHLGSAQGNDEKPNDEETGTALIDASRSSSQRQVGFPLVPKDSLPRQAPMTSGAQWMLIEYEALSKKAA